MELRYLFKKTQTVKDDSLDREKKANRPSAPNGLFHKCPGCNKTIFSDELKRNLFVCPDCGYYFRMYAMTRIESLADEGSFEEWDTDIKETNPLGTPGYEKKIESLKETTELDEAVTCGKCSIDGIDTVLCVMDTRFMMASMGQVVGEKITRAVERATEERLPVIIFCASGGARMQEGIISLMQMAKTSAALERHSKEGLLYVSVLTDPTTGGVTASFAMLGDIILAEPGALIGFAGPRVIEQTIGQKLPEGFQRAEFLEEHGFVDAVVQRGDMKDTLSKILKLHSKGEFTPSGVKAARKKGKKAKHTPWEKVMISRGKDRPIADDYIAKIFPDFTEFRGDRYYRDNKAVRCGIATFAGIPVTVIAQAKGANTKENIARDFGMPSPDGYRKALRAMKQAEKFGRPIICLVDTPGAFCGIEAEERGEGEAIARNLAEMSALKTPIISIVISEAGSGGALAIAVADKVFMLENSIYAILSPEGYASILWKDSKRADEAAAEMKLTADDLLDLGVIDGIIAEPENLSRKTVDEVTPGMISCIESFINETKDISVEELISSRYGRFRKF
ncbi:MAG: acetyl-CoA carboxylase carboxyltransferase subunit beta [Clostridiales bacterium]|nr:acetyl-CoA carboxylase carboxyltransferase subunit beta [Clostridiales bacterium]